MPDDKQNKTPSERGAEMEVLREFAHEIRNPLNAMIGFSALIKGDNGKTLSCERMVEYATNINTATKRLLQVCERVLDEAVQGCDIVRKEPLDFNAFCQEVVTTFSVDAKEQGVTLTYDVADDFPTMMTDPVLLYEIMTNLISNAIKFTPKGGLVMVKGEVNYKNEALILVIQDTGKGIPTTILRSMMKGEAVSTSFAHANRKGWGQGMQTVQAKAKLLNGTLSVENAMNGGTVACVRLPLKESVVAAE